MKKRILSVMLCLVMVLGLLPATALAADTPPDTVYVNNNMELKSGYYFENLLSEAKSGTPSGNNYVAWYMTAY